MAALAQAPELTPPVTAPDLGTWLLEDMGLTVPDEDAPAPETLEVTGTEEEQAEPEAVVDEPTEQPTVSEPVSDTVVADWAAKVRENPKSITAVPGALRIDVIQAILTAERADREESEKKVAEVEATRLRAVDIALQRGAEIERERLRIDGIMQAAQQLEVNNPAEFVRWMNDSPQNGPAYYQWKAQGAGAPGPNTEITRAFVSTAESLLSDLTAWPELRDEAVKEVLAKNLQANPEGLRELTRIVSNKLVKAGQIPATKLTPAEREVAQAKQNVEDLKQVPRPAGITPSPASQTPNPAATNDVSALLAQGLAPALARARREGNRNRTED